MSMGMRNELREPDDNQALVDTSYGWEDWYTNVVSAANTIYNANDFPLIFFSGLSYDTVMAPIPTASNLTNSQGDATDLTFVASSFPFASKIVLEIHNYQNTATNCTSMEEGLLRQVYTSMLPGTEGVVNILPVVMTEFGYTNDNTTYTGVYASCLRSFLSDFEGGPGGWMVWVLAGSYYIRSGTQDSDEDYGLLNHDWSDWRSIENIDNAIIPMVNASLAGET